MMELPLNVLALLNLETFLAFDALKIQTVGLASFFLRMYMSLISWRDTCRKCFCLHYISAGIYVSVCYFGGEAYWEL
jgi:hypothetical protein